LSNEAKAVLDAEADRTGRSMSQIAELWLEQGRAQSALDPVSPEIMREIALMTRFAAGITQRLGDPMRSILSHTALCLGWGVIAHRALPNVMDDEIRHTSAAALAARWALGMLSPDMLADRRFSSQRDKLSGLRPLLEALAESRLSSTDPPWRQEAARLAELLAIIQDVNRVVRPSEGDNESILRWLDEEEIVVRLTAVLIAMRRAALAHDANSAGVEAAHQETVLVLAETGVIAPDEVTGIRKLMGSLCHEGAQFAKLDLERDMAKAASRKHDNEPPSAA
jgi:hypothetical protein